ncbi:uncharacterized protein LOC126681944 [Mercurialis annua]|uniref:uncharacterized protein LOC126681944 n=1 Tax=Mercurialis annua TaxID=3986 RepID=UPI00215DE949|nr:uncharacterized protein LOC126681944 [Mercurialis annua]
MINGPWICGGDFNEVFTETEKVGGGRKQQYLMRNFREAVEACNLFEVRGLENDFTWWGNRESGVVREKLDRFLINDDWSLLYPDHVAFSLGFWGSDHAPIITCHKEKIGRDSGKVDLKRRFPFEESWTANSVPKHSG